MGKWQNCQATVIFFTENVYTECLRKQAQFLSQIQQYLTCNIEIPVVAYDQFDGHAEDHSRYSC